MAHLQKGSSGKLFLKTQGANPSPPPDGSVIPLIVVDRQDRIRYMSSEFRRLTGHGVEAAGRSLSAILSAPVRENPARALRAAIGEGRAWRGEVALVCPDKRSRTIRLWVLPAEEPEIGGQSEAVLDAPGLCTDCGQGPCGRDQSRFTELIEHLDVGIFRTTAEADGRLLEANSALVNLFEAESKEELMNCRVSDLYRDPDRRRLFHEKMHREKSVRDEVLEFVTLKGRRFVGSITASLKMDGGQAFFDGILEDITEQLRTRRDLEQLFMHSIDLVCLAGTDGFFKRVNPAFVKTLGYAEQEILSHPFMDLVHPDDRGATSAAVEALLAGLPVLEFENRYLCKDGGYKHLEWRASPGTGRGTIFAIARDVTDRRRAERAERSLVEARIEFTIAGEIQRALLPATVPSIPGFDVAGLSRPAEEVGGDYYDVIPLKDGRIGLVIGDATGHGIAPSLLMAQTRSSIWSLVHASKGILEILEITNRVIHAGAPSNFFVTLGFASCDPATRTVRYAGCGHPPGLIFDGHGRIKTRLESTGLPLGLFPEHSVALGPELRLEAGDLLLLLTDGVTEAISPGRVEFGVRRLSDIVHAHIDDGAGAIVAALDAAVRGFQGNRPSLDDFTLLAAKLT